MIKQIYSSEQRQNIFGHFLLFKPDQVLRCDELHLWLLYELERN